MKNKIEEILENHINLPEKIKLSLPKLNKINSQKLNNQKLKLPKLKII